MSGLDSQALDAAYAVMVERVFAHTGKRVGDPISLQDDLHAALVAAAPHMAREFFAVHLAELTANFDGERIAQAIESEADVAMQGSHFESGLRAAARIARGKR